MQNVFYVRFTSLEVHQVQPTMLKRRAFVLLELKYQMSILWTVMCLHGDATKREQYACKC